MPEIFPNWHPAVVHFPIALGLTATMVLAAAVLRPKDPGLAASGRLLLQIAAVSAIVAAALGWQAFQTVDHDAAGHRVMLRHRDWAIACTFGLLACALWESWRQRAGRAMHPATLVALLFLSGGLAHTGWLGGEMVYRHGVGVSAAAFASPEVVPPPTLPAEPAPSAPAAEPAVEAPPASSEHIHKDGKRHRH